MLMFNQYPYLNLTDLNLDNIIKSIDELKYQVDNFVSINAINYADPLEWDITRQYEKNTVVIDPQTGTAYLSVDAVPRGISLSRPEYWTVVFDLSAFIAQGNQNLTEHVEGAGVVYSTFALNINDWVVWNGVLYKALVNMPIGTAYSVNGNIKRVTVEEYIKDILTAIANEVQARIDADTLLRNDLDTEVLTRQNADTVLENAIKNKPFVNVKDFGAVGDGVTDDYQAFVDAYNSTTEGSKIIVPFGTYNLSNNPDSHTKNIEWVYDYGTKFIGAGAYGGLEGVTNGFISPASNPFNKVVRANSKMYNTITSPVGGGICVDNYEVQSSNRINKTITGTITNGSAIMTNVNDLDSIAIGDSILAPTVTGWLDGSTRANSVRVVDIDEANNTITFGSTPAPKAIAGDGWCIPTPWTGTTQTASFIIRPRIWTVNKYLGLETSSVDNIDEFGYLINGVFNVNGGVGNAIELDVNLMGAASGGVTGLLLTGIGDANSPNYGIRIDRGGRQSWTTGIDINNCVFGIGISAYEPILIRSAFYDNVTQDNISPLFGVIFDNIQDMVNTTRPLFAGEQIVNNSVGLLLARATDTNPNGAFISCVNKARTDEIFKVDVNGEMTVPTIRVKQNFVPETITCNYTFTIKDASGSVLKVPCYFGG